MFGAETGLDALSRGGGMHAGHGPRGDPLAGLELDAAPGQQLEQESGGADRAVREESGASGAGLDPIDQSCHGPALESARAPIGNLGPDQYTVIVAEIRDDRGWPERIDRGERRACDLDADMHRLDQPGRFL